MKHNLITALLVSLVAASAFAVLAADNDPFVSYGK